MQTNAKKILTIGMFAFMTISVLGYAYFRAQDFLRGPVVDFTAPKNGIVVSNPLLEIQGTSQNLSFLALNGRKIFTDTGGAWKEKILLSSGYNVIQAEAKDRFGREIKKTLQIIYKENGGV